jgi:hypothetical protein
MLYTVLLHPNYSQYCSTPVTPAMGRVTDPLFIVTSLSSGWLRVVFQQEQGIFLFSKPSRLTIGPTKPPFPWVLPMAPSLALSSQGMRMTAHLHLAPRLKMSAATLTSPYTSSWHIRETTFCLGYNLSTLFQLWKVYSIKWYKMTNRKYSRIWKEALKAYLTVLSWHSP